MARQELKRETLSRAVQLADKVGYVFISTGDDKGWPHLAVAGRMAITPQGHIAVFEWFCPGTISNLQVNSKLGVVVWDAASDEGYQLVGELEEMKEVGMLDGFTPGLDKQPRVPQVERELVVHVDRITEFHRAPHTDQPE